MVWTLSLTLTLTLTLTLAGPRTSFRSLKSKKCVRCELYHQSLYWYLTPWEYLSHCCGIGIVYCIIQNYHTILVPDIVMNIWTAEQNLHYLIKTTFSSIRPLSFTGLVLYYCSHQSCTVTLNANNIHSFNLQLSILCWYFSNLKVCLLDQLPCIWTCGKQMEILHINHYLLDLSVL